MERSHHYIAQAARYEFMTRNRAKSFGFPCFCVSRMSTLCRTTFVGQPFSACSLAALSEKEFPVRGWYSDKDSIPFPSLACSAYIFYLEEFKQKTSWRLRLL